MKSDESPPLRTNWRRSQLKWIMLVFVVSAVVVIAGFSMSLLDQPVDLIVSEAATTGVIQGNLYEINKSSILFLNFSATTYANQSVGPSSTLTLELRTLTYYSSDTYMAITTVVYASVFGNFDSSLRTRNVQIFCNQTSPDATVNSRSYGKGGVNVSFEEPLTVAFLGSGSGTLTARLVNRTTDYPNYEFSYLEGFFIWHYDLDVNSVCFQATVNGDFEPSVCASVVLRLINAQT